MNEHNTIATVPNKFVSKLQSTQRSNLFHLFSSPIVMQLYFLKSWRSALISFICKPGTLRNIF